MTKLKNKSGRYGKRRSGAVLIEFAACVVVLIFLLMGIMEFGWLAHNKLKLANAARDGARDAAIGFSTDEVKARIKSRLTGIPNLEPSATNGGLIIDLKKSSYDGTNYTYTTNLGNKPANAAGKVYNDADTDQLIRVNLSITHKPLTGIVPKHQSQVAVIMRREASG